MATSEYIIENVVIAMLSAQAALSGVSIKHWDEDTDAEMDRIRVRCEPRKEFLKAHKDTLPPILWSSETTIEIRVGTRTSALIETYGTAVDAAMASTPAAAVTAAASLASIEFPSDESGSRQGDGAETYVREKNYTAIFS